MSLRYLFSKKKSLVSFISFISIIGVAIGVASLITVLAVMSGFGSELRKKIIGSNPHIIVDKEGGISDYDALSRKIRSIEGVKNSYPYICGQAVIRFRTRTQGIVIRSVDTSNKIDFERLNSQIKQGALKFEKDSIIIGNELSSALGAFIGDELSVITSSSGKITMFKIQGIFNSGMYEYDLNLAYVTLSSASELFDMQGLVGGIGIETDNIDNVNLVRDRTRTLLPVSYYIRTWMDMNRSLFSALRLEKITMFIILTLIIIVAALNIVSTLTVMVTEKTKDIGTLKAIGATRPLIVAIFSLQGFIIGLFGVIIGSFGGIGLSLLIKKYQFITLPKDIYYISRIPVEISLSDTVVIVVAALFISFAASLYPAYQASRLSPVDSLRYE